LPGLSCSRPFHPSATVAPANEPSIEGRWNIIELNGEKIILSKAGKELPFLEFDLEEKKLSGSTGCNRISGKFSYTASSIDFEPLAATKMACDRAYYEIPLLQILRGNLSYLLESDLLSIFKEGKAVIVMRAPD